MTYSVETFSIIELLEERIRSPDYRKGEKTKYRLMQAAARLFVDHAYDEVRNVDICRGAGVSTGMLNNYFKDKDELIAQLLGMFLQIYHSEYQLHFKELDHTADAYEKIYYRFDYNIKMAIRNLGMFRLLIIEAPRIQSEKLNALVAKTAEFWVGDLAQLIPSQKSGLRLSKKDKTVMAYLMSGTPDEAIRNLILKRGLDENYPTQRLIEMMAIFRYASIFGEDPSVESRKMIPRA